MKMNFSLWHHFSSCHDLTISFVIVLIFSLSPTAQPQRIAYANSYASPQRGPPRSPPVGPNSPISGSSFARAQSQRRAPLSDQIRYLKGAEGGPQPATRAMHAPIQAPMKGYRSVSPPVQQAQPVPSVGYPAPDRYSRQTGSNYPPSGPAHLNENRSPYQTSSLPNQNQKGYRTGLGSRAPADASGRDGYNSRRSQPERLSQSGPYAPPATGNDFGYPNEQTPGSGGYNSKNSSPVYGQQPPLGDGVASPDIPENDPEIPDEAANGGQQEGDTEQGSASDYERELEIELALLRAERMQKEADTNGDASYLPEGSPPVTGASYLPLAPMSTNIAVYRNEVSPEGVYGSYNNTNNQGSVSSKKNAIHDLEEDEEDRFITSDTGKLRPRFVYPVQMGYDDDDDVIDTESEYESEVDSDHDRDYYQQQKWDQQQQQQQQQQQLPSKVWLALQTPDKLAMEGSKRFMGVYLKNDQAANQGRMSPPASPSRAGTPLRRSKRSLVTMSSDSIDHPSHMVDEEAINDKTPVQVVLRRFRRCGGGGDEYYYDDDDDGDANSVRRRRWGHQGGNKTVKKTVKKKENKKKVKKPKKKKVVKKTVTTKVIKNGHVQSVESSEQPAGQTTTVVSSAQSQPIVGSSVASVQQPQVVPVPVQGPVSTTVAAAAQAVQGAPGGQVFVQTTPAKEVHAASQTTQLSYGQQPQPQQQPQQQQQTTSETTTMQPAQPVAAVDTQ